MMTFLFPNYLYWITGSLQKIHAFTKENLVIFEWNSSHSIWSWGPYVSFSIWNKQKDLDFYMGSTFYGNSKIIPCNDLHHLILPYTSNLHVLWISKYRSSNLQVRYFESNSLRTNLNHELILFFFFIWTIFHLNI